MAFQYIQHKVYNYSFFNSIAIFIVLSPLSPIYVAVRLDISIAIGTNIKVNGLMLRLSPDTLIRESTPEAKLEPMVRVKINPNTMPGASTMPIVKK